MKIQEAVKKSIEHGYSLRGIGPNGFYELLDRYSSDVFLDPLFWQSLGKAMGWNKHEIRDNAYYKVCEHCHLTENELSQPGIFESPCTYPFWKDKWHDFIDHLAEGKDAESFFEKI